MAYKLRTTKQFEKDVKRCFKRGLPLDKLRKVMELLEKDGFLPQSYPLIFCMVIAKGNGNVI